jgi:hypothetical protein
MLQHSPHHLHGTTATTRCVVIQMAHLLRGSIAPSPTNPTIPKPGSAARSASVSSAVVMCRTCGQLQVAAAAEPGTLQAMHEQISAFDTSSARRDSHSKLLTSCVAILHHLQQTQPAPSQEVQLVVPLYPPLWRCASKWQHHLAQGTAAPPAQPCKRSRTHGQL